MAMKNNKRKQFEAREVHTKGELRKLHSTGYEAIRVSPRTTTKFGKKYKKVYGASVSPDYSRGKKGKYGARVEWWPHGFTVPSAKSGTRLLQPLKAYPVNKEEARRKLMIKPRKRRKKK